MKKYTPQALAAAEKWARLTTGFLAALFLFYAYWMLADLELRPDSCLPARISCFPGAVWNTLRTVILACAAEAGFWYNLAQETGREVPASTIRIALLILLAGDVLLAVRNGLGPAAVVASLAAVLLMDLLFELSLRQFSRVDAVRAE